MDPTEVQDRLKKVINALIRDNPDEAKQGLHDVLAAKMRERIGTEQPEDVDPDVTDTDPTDAVDAEDSDATTTTEDPPKE